MTAYPWGNPVVVEDDVKTVLSSVALAKGDYTTTAGQRKAALQIRFLRPARWPTGFTFETYAAASAPKA
jgi:hypothetical protein